MGNAFVVTEGLNNTISMCVLLTGGYLAKPVELILENQCNIQKLSLLHFKMFHDLFAH